MQNDRYCAALDLHYDCGCGCGCGCTPGACSCNRGLVLATEIGLALEGCDGVQIEVTL